MLPPESLNTPSIPLTLHQAPLLSTVLLHILCVLFLLPLLASSICVCVVPPPHHPRGWVVVDVGCIPGWILRGLCRANLPLNGYYTVIEAGLYCPADFTTLASSPADPRRPAGHYLPGN